MKKIYILSFSLLACLLGLSSLFSKALESSAKKKPVFEAFSKVYSKSFIGSCNSFKSNSIIWEQKESIPFTELIMSWNAHRPKQGYYMFYVSVLNNTWSPWVRFAQWGNNHQRTFAGDSNFFKVAYSRVIMKNNYKGKGFRVKIAALNGASIFGIHKLYSCLSDLSKFKIFKRCQNLQSVKLDSVPRQSQKVLDHERTGDLCSPTSVGIVVSYLCSKMKINHNFSNNLPHKIVEFSRKVHDDGVLQIYGNWMLNTAQAYDSSGSKIFSRVERLNDFLDIYKYLRNKIPVVVSIRGIKGGATPYANGHLLVVVGWDKEKQNVCCVDPAFPSNSATKISYNINDFLSAWGRSRNLAYVFLPKDPIL